MEKWLGPCLLLCIFGFLKELRPSEPFVTEFLVGTWKNFTVEEVIGLLHHYLFLLDCSGEILYIIICVNLGYAGHLPCVDIFLFISFVCGLPCN